MNSCEKIRSVFGSVTTGVQASLLSIGLGTMLFVGGFVSAGCQGENPCECGDTDAAEVETPEGAWYDPDSGLTWENPASSDPFAWGEAERYCYDLVIGDLEDWRLPTISELRSLVRGCPEMEIGGACGVTDECADYPSCTEGSDCLCNAKKGPDEGCFWPEPLEGPCGDGQFFWSATPVRGNLEYEAAWFLGYSRAETGWNQKMGSAYVRCVREQRKFME